MHSDVLVFTTNNKYRYIYIYIYIYKKKNNCWLNEFVPMKPIQDISEIIAKK